MRAIGACSAHWKSLENHYQRPTMTDPTPLSPAALAVLDAYKIASDGHYTDAGEWIQNHAGQIAAALRAAALACKRDSAILLSLADELDGAQ